MQALIGDQQLSKVSSLGSTDWRDKVSAFATVIEAERGSLSGEHLSTAREISNDLKEALKSRYTAKLTNKLRLTDSRVDEMLELENKEDPQSAAWKYLSKRVPSIIFFDAESRNLRQTYKIDIIREGAPAALGNILSVGGTSGEEIVNTADTGSAAQIATIENRINQRLKTRFQEAWQQSGVHVWLRLTSDVLEVQIVNEEQTFTDFDERSDGLRQFVALQCFVMKNRVSNPILLIDEAEQRLHYDAQADLVQMFAKQAVASKIIYTTHSAGCLPEDMGNGVRLVRPLDDSSQFSSIVNKFWTSGGRGFEPMLFGMGASTSAFFPTRKAVLVEGPSDMLLLPVMIRTAMKLENLGYQFVPGLSSSGQFLAPLLNDADAHIVYLVDSDNGGLKLEGKLIESGVNPRRIVALGKGSQSIEELEDFLDPDILIKAGNKIIGRFHTSSPKIDVSKISRNRRMRSLEVEYLRCTGAQLPKVELAYEILDIMYQSPTMQLIDPRRVKTLRKTAEKIGGLFN